MPRKIIYKDTGEEVDATIFYQLGKRDMLAEMFMMFRTDEKRDFKRFLISMANLYQTHYDNHKDINPHVKWFKDNYKI